MRFESVKCDRCGKVKGEANKWWGAVVWPDRLVKIKPIELDLNGVYAGASELDLCSQQCVLEVVTDVMDGKPL